MMRNTAYKERGFGLPTNYFRSNSKQSEPDRFGGDMSQLINNQYERDYIDQARQMDALYQKQATSNKRRMQAHQTLMPSGTVIMNDNHSNKLRMEAIQKKILKMNGQSPSQMNTMLITDSSTISSKPTKKSLYDSESIKKYIFEKNIQDENKRKKIDDFLSEHSTKAPIDGSKKMSLVGTHHLVPLGSFTAGTISS